MFPASDPLLFEMMKVEVALSSAYDADTVTCPKPHLSMASGLDMYELSAAGRICWIMQSPAVPVATIKTA